MMTQALQGSLVDQLRVFAERIADLRSGAADAQRDAYTVTLGQMLQLGLIEEHVYREAIDRPRRRRGQR